MGHAPWVNPTIAKDEYGMELHNNILEKSYDAVILAVVHSKFDELDIAKITKSNSIVYDVKGFLKILDERL